MHMVRYTLCVRYAEQQVSVPPNLYRANRTSRSYHTYKPFVPHLLPFHATTHIRVVCIVYVRDPGWYCTSSTLNNHRKTRRLDWHQRTCRWDVHTTPWTDVRRSKVDYYTPQRGGCRHQMICTLSESSIRDDSNAYRHFPHRHSF